MAAYNFSGDTRHKQIDRPELLDDEKQAIFRAAAKKVEEDVIEYARSLGEKAPQPRTAPRRPPQQKKQQQLAPRQPQQMWEFMANVGDPWGILEKPGDNEVKGTQQLLGSVLPPIARSNKCPGESAIPEHVRRRMSLEDESFGDEKAKKPKLYVLVFPGAADSVSAGWARLEAEAPEYIEFATYEWPGHGGRAQEPRMNTMRDLGDDAFGTFRDALMTGHFAVVGHSIGVLIATYICIRAERELGVQPQAAFMIERQPPHMKSWTEHGLDMMIRRPQEWIELYNPSLGKAAREKLYDGVEDSVAMWANDEQVSHHTIPVGSYRFPCKLFVFIALDNYKWEKFVEYNEERTSLTLNGLHASTAKLEWYPEWEDWGDRVAFHRIHTDHMNSKNHLQVVGVIYRVVKDILQRAELRAQKGGS